jgi:hypothetical protein
MSQLEELAVKYPTDKLIKTLLTKEHLRMPRYPFEYGVYDIEEEVKIKQWVKIDPKKPGEKYEESINKKLVNTFTGPEFANTQDKDQVLSLLGEEDLEKEPTWLELGPTLHEAMLVKAHNHLWFRDCILKYLERINGDNNKLETNQLIFKKVFKYLNELGEN